MSENQVTKWGRRRRWLISVLLVLALLLVATGSVVSVEEFPMFFVGIWVTALVVLLLIIGLGLLDIVLTYYHVSYTLERAEIRELKRKLHESVSKREEVGQDQ